MMKVNKSNQFNKVTLTNHLMIKKCAKSPVCEWNGKNEPAMFLAPVCTVHQCPVPRFSSPGQFLLIISR